MSRRQSSLATLLVALPWWVSVILAAIAYMALAYGAPNLNLSNPFLQPIAKITAPLLAWPATLFLLALAVASALTALYRRRLLDRQQDLGSLRQTTWQDFERLVGEVYRRQGYRVVETGGGGADGGIDLKLVKNGETWLVQCKRWRQEKVGVKVARELFGVVASEQATGGILITTSTFTPEAESFGRGKPLRLIAGKELLRMVEGVQKGGGSLDTPTATRIEPTLAFTPSELTSAKLLCPQCKAPMVRRVARQGRNAGQAFWGCSRFPECRATQPVQ
ncbi:MAG TPA: restriction endonuclease [Candidatus Contendobacter sp.]|nr:restriction endonuclease [Candidatus Competibacteraceae bacterium]HRZ52201.1 restriction endonuclease [Candidatus Contendobacter sp.]